MAEAQAGSGTQSGILGWIERSGNKLPDPVFLFFWLIAILVVVSIAASLAGLSAAHPTEVDADTGAATIITAQSLLNAENIARLWVEMPQTFTHFHPLGYVLVVMLGAGVAERAGLFGTAMRAGVRNAPIYLLTPIVAFVGMFSVNPGFYLAVAGDPIFMIGFPVLLTVYLMGVLIIRRMVDLKV